MFVLYCVLPCHATSLPCSSRAHASCLASFPSFCIAFSCSLLAWCLGLSISLGWRLCISFQQQSKFLFLLISFFTLIQLQSKATSLRSSVGLLLFVHRSWVIPCIDDSWTTVLYILFIDPFVWCLLVVLNQNQPRTSSHLEISTTRLFLLRSCTSIVKVALLLFSYLFIVFWLSVLWVVNWGIGLFFPSLWWYEEGIE